MEYDGFGPTEGTGVMSTTGAMERVVPMGMRTCVGDEEQLLVTACGRTCPVDSASARSLEQLQLFLQRTLGMDGQEFQVCDINGTILTTDFQVQEAIAQGLTPLGATLPDKSLHHMENRRQDLAQMQWKLVRDQITASGHQFTSLTRQLNEFQLQFQAFQREVQNALETMQSDTVKAFQEERQTTKDDNHATQEAVNGMAVLISTERNKRELSIQGFEKHIHGVCDMIDNEKIARRQDLSSHQIMLEELKASLETEKANREKVEQNLGDLKAQVWQLREDSIRNNHDLREQIQRARDSDNTSGFDLQARFSMIEDRYTTLEQNVDNISSFSAQTVDNLTERQERVSQSVETVRLSCKYLEGNLERIKELEASMKQSYSSLYDRFAKEKTSREDGLRRTNQTLMNDTRKLIGDLEKRLTIRLERESADREKNFKTMIDEVSSIVDDRKLFRDQLITKTIKVQDPTSATPLPSQTPKTSFVPSSTPLVVDADTPYLTQAHEKGAIPAMMSPLGSDVTTPSYEMRQQPQRQLVLSASTGAINAMVSSSVFHSPKAMSAEMPTARSTASVGSARMPVAMSSTGNSTPRSDVQPLMQQPLRYSRSGSPLMVSFQRSGSAVPSFAMGAFARSGSPLASQVQTQRMQPSELIARTVD
mmetsp:Transcript_41221/g.65811  ORF Transcript_41221/g.65811 Transcript_41221/m.65811 type:complete len:650 (+) Transcript_41221:58-2007(+)